MDSNQLDEAERVAVQFVKHSKAVPGVLITATPSAAAAAKAAAAGKSGEQTAAGQESETKKKTKKKKRKHPRGPSVTTLAKRLLKEVRQAKVDAIRAKARQQQAAAAAAGAGGATSVQ